MYTGSVLGQGKLVRSQQAGRCNSSSNNYGTQYNVIQPTEPTDPTWHNQHPAAPEAPISQVGTLTLVHHIVREDHAKRRAKEVLGILGRSASEGDTRGQRHLWPMFPVSTVWVLCVCPSQSASPSPAFPLVCLFSSSWCTRVYLPACLPALPLAKLKIDLHSTCTP